MQQRVARAFVAMFEDAEVSFQLSEWFRLAGRARRCRGVRRGPRRLVAQVSTPPARLTPSGRPYVDLARARAPSSSARSDRARPVDRLDRLAGDLSVPAHLRWSACRWSLQALEQVGESSESVARLGYMAREAAKGPHAERYLVLADARRRLRAQQRRRRAGTSS